MQNSWLSKRNFLGFITLVSLASLSFAYIAQYGYGVNPCPMCYYERYIYWFIAVIGCIGYTFPHFSKLMMKFIGITLVVGVGVGVYHLGIENHWWPAPAVCTGVPLADSPEQFLANLKQQAPARCTEIGWRIFNISATIWNLVWFVGFLLAWEGVRRLTASKNNNNHPYTTIS
jgi:disulfide bond formation protein DsbB